MTKINKSVVVMLFVTVLFMAPVYATTNFASLPGTDGLASYTGNFTYAFTTAASATIQFVINNTTAATTGGYLTAFAFNNPGNKITGVSLASAPANFNVIGGSTYQDSVNGMPFGYLAIGASTATTGAPWEGGGDPHKGIAAGNSGTFNFDLTGNNLNTLSEADFITSLSSGGSSEWAGQFLAVRFRGFPNGGSDKVPGKMLSSPPVVPEPVSSSLFLLGAGALGIRRLRRRKKS